MHVHIDTYTELEAPYGASIIFLHSCFVILTFQHYFLVMALVSVVENTGV